MTYTNNFDGLVQFKSDIIEPLTKGRSLDDVTFAPGYREVYERWTAVVGDALIKMSPDERLNSFTDFLREDNKRFADATINRMITTPAKKKEWRQAASRGQVLRVSTDGVKFNKLIRSDQLDKVSDTTTFVLSDTCRSTTNDLQEVCNEQSALLFTGKLRSQHFLVENVEPGSVFKAEVVHPKSGAYTVSVDLNKPFTDMLSFAFENAKGESKILEMNEVGQAYGMLEDILTADKATRNLLIETGVDESVSNIESIINKQNANKLGAGAAMTAAIAANQKTVGLQPGELPGTVLPTGVVVPNIMQAKENVNARIERANLAREESQKQEKQSRKQEKESMREAALYREEQKQKQMEIQSKDAQRRKSMYQATGAVGAFAGLGSAALGWIIM